MKKIILTPIIVTTISILLSTCRGDKSLPDYGKYPKEVGEILINNCATAGCHNTASKDAAVGLDLSSWDKLFEGGRNNSSVIPYRPDQSFLMFSVNTFSDLGPKLIPTMPYNKAPLSRHQVEVLYNWIAQGAPNADGFVKWSDNPNRRKIYVVNQGCDLLTVFDAKTKLMMRVINVGDLPSTESPHDMMISPDQQDLYISFYLSNIFQRFRTSDGQKTGEINLGSVGWHSMSISGNSKYALVSHLDADGKVALIDLQKFAVKVMYQGSNYLVYPHGSAFNYDGTLAYVTAQQGNFLYKMNLKDPMDPDQKKIPLAPGEVPNVNGKYKPYSVAFSPDYSKYYVTCQGTNELRIFQTSNDSLLEVIPTTGVPQVLSFSEKYPYVYIPCMADTANPTTKSSVNIIDLNTNKVITSLYTGYDPRSCAVDDENNCVWVANRNLYGAGWKPHHTTSCAGRNGYMTIIDQSTLQLIPDWKCEVSVDPYHVTIRK